MATYEDVGCLFDEQDQRNENSNKYVVITNLCLAPTM